MRLNADDVLNLKDQERLLEAYLTIEPYSSNFFKTALGNGCKLTAYVVLIAIKQKRWRDCLSAKTFTNEAVKVFRALNKSEEIMTICFRVKNYYLAYCIDPAVTLAKMSCLSLWDDLYWLAEKDPDNGDLIKSFIKEDENL